MEQTVLAPHQFDFLEYVQKETNLTTRYYLTGGTALAAFYLKHRYSEDIDFFSQHEVYEADITAFLDYVTPKLNIIKIEPTHIGGLFMYTLIYSDQTSLKVDFAEYDFPQVEQGKKHGNIWIDSLYDIAVNKLYTILSRSKARDFVDLYFCIKQEEYSWEQLFGRVKDKFGVSFEEVTVVTQFAHVQDVTDYPTMLVAFNKQEMIDFYLSEAKKLEPKIFK